MKKFLGLLAVIALLAGPSLSAKDCHKDSHNDCNGACPISVTGNDVKGTYSFSGFSNSLCGVVPQSQAVVGLVKFKNDGTGTIIVADFVISTGASIQNIHRENVPFTYQLPGPDGSGIITVPNFPVVGTTPVFAVVFKRCKGNVFGFRGLTTESTPGTPRWTLIEGERFD